MDLVGTCLGRHRGEVRVWFVVVPKFSLRDFLAEIALAVIIIGHRAGLDIQVEVSESRGILDHGFADIDRTARVFIALFSYNALFIDAIVVRLAIGDAVKLLIIVGAHIDKAQLAHAFLTAANLCTTLRRFINDKVSLGQGREGQLSFALVHHNGIAVIQGGQGQCQAVCGKLSAGIIVGRSTVDVLDLLAEGDIHLNIADTVKLLGLLRHNHAVYAFHRAVVCNDQLAQLLTISTVPAFDGAKAHRIGNSSLAGSIRHQAAGDHGISDDRSFQCIIVGQLDIVEHAAKDLGITTIQLDSCVELTAVDGATSLNILLEGAAGDGAVIAQSDIRFELTIGDLAVSFDALLEGAAGDGAAIAQSDIRVELTIGDLTVSLDALLEDAVGDGSISFDALLEGAAGDAAVFIRVDSLLESAALNNDVLGGNRRTCLNVRNRHIRQYDLIGSNGLMIGVDGIRGQIHRAAIGAGEDKHRHRSITNLDHSVLPAQTLVDITGHTILVHEMRGHTVRVGLTFFGNAQGLEVAGIARLIYQNLLAIVVAVNMQYITLGIGLFICTVDAVYIGVQGKLCAGIAHQIDGIDRTGQVSAVDRSHTAVAHGQLAELLANGKRILYAVVRQLAQNGVGNGKVAKPVKAEALGHYIGNGALARAGEVIKGAALDRDIFEVSLTDDAAGHGSIRKLDSAVDGHCAQLAEIDLLTALIPELQFSGHTGDIGVASISPALAKVYADLASILVQTVHMGHTVHIGHTLTGKTQFLVRGRDRSQCYGCVAL